MIEGSEFAEAEKNLQTVMKLDPTIPQIYQLRAQLAYAREDYKAAVGQATRALEIAENQDTFSIRGDAQFKLQNYEAALADYRSARRLDTQVQQALELRAAELEKSGNVQQAGYYREQASAISRISQEAPAEESAEEPSPFPESAGQAQPIEGKQSAETSEPESNKTAPTEEKTVEAPQE